MNDPEKALKLIMQISAFILVTALFPAVMPFTWMDAIHQRLGLGELPEIPIVHYLTRSLSAMYALHGALVFYLSLNVRRFLPVVKFAAVLGILFGIGMTALDASIGFPIHLIIFEGPVIIVLGFVLLWLATRVQESPGNASTRENMSG